MNNQSPTPERAYWKKCNICKKEIGFGSVYQVCSVSTCRGERLGLVFCSVDCWDGHLGDARHRDPWAEEKQSPTRAEFLQDQAPAGASHPEPQRRIVIPTPKTAPQPSPHNAPVETLVVVSKVKALIHKLSDYNASQCAIDALTKVVVHECQKAIETARASGRKTVMGRDFSKS